MTLALDSSFVVAALVDGGPVGTWAADRMQAEPLVAPHLMPAEVANVLRRAESAGEISPDVASMAHADLLALPIVLFPYEPFADRVWQLRATVTSYDAWYVALAEVFEVTLATVDRRLSRASGPRCSFALPPD